ncbi:MAG: hypothetical protein RRC07_02105 [Anaerolineae bacterium]|nr:hypothetical protein [Anaerolineae bacterium]
METRRAEPASQPGSPRLFAVLGLLWLLLAAAIVIWQFVAPIRITVTWETETEVNSAGFNIYRSQAPDGAYQRLNDQLVPSRGSPVTGASYQYVDDDVAAGETYYYRLEDVELDNSTELHDVLQYTAPAITWWIMVAAVFSALFGVLLLIKGIQ